MFSFGGNKQFEALGTRVDAVVNKERSVQELARADLRLGASSARRIR